MATERLPYRFETLWPGVTAAASAARAYEETRWVCCTILEPGTRASIMLVVSPVCSHSRSWHSSVMGRTYDSFTDMLGFAQHLVKNPKVFDRKVNWWRNGEAGKLHAYNHCPVLKEPQAKVNLHLSPVEAASYLTCGECAIRGILQLAPPQGVFSRLLHLYSTVNYCQGYLQEDLGLADVLGVLEMLRAALSELDQYLDPGSSSVDRGVYAQHAAGIILEEGLVVESSLSTIIRSGRGEIEREAAAATFMSVLKRPSDCLALSAEIQFFGGGDRHLADESIYALFGAWKDLHVYEPRPDSTRDELVVLLDSLTLKSVSQLAGLKLTLLPEEDMEQAALRCWEENLLRFTDSMFARWSGMLQERLAPKRVHLVGMYQAYDAYTDDEVLYGLIQEAFEFKYDTVRGTTFLKTSSAVMKWLTANVQDYTPRSGVPTIQSYPADLPDDVLEIIMTLWDPSDVSGSSYTSLRECVKAARKLLK